MRTVLFFAWPQFDDVEVAFWRRLANALRTRGLRLVIACDAEPPADLGVPCLRVPRRVDSVWPLGGGTVARVPLAALGLDARHLLDREEAWGEPSILPAVARARERNVEHIAAFWTSLLALLRPVVTLIWNGQHVPELVLDALCRQGGCPVLTIERAPIPRALFVDDRGLSTASAVARTPRWQPSQPERWRAVARLVSTRLGRGGVTWWEQPTRDASADDLRARLDIAPACRILLFAGQVDEDTQQFLFSPHFGSNLEAFSWWLGQLEGRRDVFVLGKHHPRSTASPEAYRRVLAASGIPGAWRDDVPLDAALAASDRVAAVNSTVLYEALSRDLPVLVLGEWLLSGRGVGYEVDGTGDAGPLIDRWLHDVDGASHRRAWIEALAYLLERSIVAYEPAPISGGMREAGDLAHEIAARALGQTGWACPDALLGAVLTNDNQVPAWWTPWDGAWQHRIVTDLDEAASTWQAADRLRQAVSRIRRAGREGRRVLIWGTGRAGRLCADVLARSGTSFAAFVSSTAAAGSTCEGRPVLAPHALDPDRDWVVVAAAAHEEIATQLATAGIGPDHYHVLDPAVLLAAAADVDDDVACRKES